MHPRKHSFGSTAVVANEYSEYPSTVLGGGSLSKSYDSTRLIASGDTDENAPLLRHPVDIVCADADRGDGHRSSHGCFPCRYVLCGVSFLAFFVLYCMRVNLSIAIVQMADEKHFNWDKPLQGRILGSFYYGYIFMQLPAGYLSTRFGGKWVMGLGLLMTSVLTLLTPLVAHNVTALTAIRIVTGFSEGVAYPSMNAIYAHWAPPMERAVLLTITYSGAHFGTFVTMMLSGYLCQHNILGGWPSVFYVTGLMGIVWFILWWILMYSRPGVHPWINSSEREFIETSIHADRMNSIALERKRLQEQRQSAKNKGSGKPTRPSGRHTDTQVDASCEHSRIQKSVENFPSTPNDGSDVIADPHTTVVVGVRHSTTAGGGGGGAAGPAIAATVGQATERPPWGQILLSLPAWSIFQANFCNNWGFYALLTCMPQFLKEVLHYDLQSSGLMSSLPYLCLAIVTGISGPIADYLRRKKVSVVFIRKSFTLFAMGSSALFLMLSPFVSESQKEIAVVYLCVGLALNGFMQAGFNVNILDIAPRYAGIIMGFSNGLGTIPGFVAPIVTDLITKDKTRSEWVSAFIIPVVLYVFGALFFLVFGSVNRQPWADPHDHSMDEDDDNDDIDGVDGSTVDDPTRNQFGDPAGHGNGNNPDRYFEDPSKGGNRVRMATNSSGADVPYPLSSDSPTVSGGDTSVNTSFVHARLRSFSE